MAYTTARHLTLSMYFCREMSPRSNSKFILLNFILFLFLDCCVRRTALDETKYPRNGTPLRQSAKTKGFSCSRSLSLQKDSILTSCSRFGYSSFSSSSTVSSGSLVQSTTRSAGSILDSMLFAVSSAFW